MNTTAKSYNPAKDPVLTKIVSTIVSAVDPDKIILFGSRAIGKSNNNSDYDICVLKNESINQHKLSQKIYSSLFGIGASVDIVVQNSKRFETLKDKWFLIYHDVAKFGKIIYQSPAHESDGLNILREEQIEYSPKEGNEEFVSKWLQKAESNLEIAKIGKVSKKVLYDDLCFECQQAAEKSIKAILISIDKKFEKTHNIEDLLELIKKSGIDIPKPLKESIQLTSYATTSRYPGDYIPASAGDYKKALNIAEKVLKWAKSVTIEKSQKLF